MANVDTARNTRQADKSVPSTTEQASTSKVTSATRTPGEFRSLEWEMRLRDTLEIGGLWTRDAKAPTYEELRPYGPRETAGFPVYKDLEQRLLDAVAHPDPEIAHVMAACAAYAYSGPETVSMIMARMGLQDNQCRMIQTSVDAMMIHSTAFLIQSKSGRVGILCYRGAEPHDAAHRLGDADREPERIAYRACHPSATVHAGIYRNVRATRYEVMNALRHASDRHSVRTSLPNGSPGLDLGRVDGRLEALYITGHGHGGAMAALMGVMIRHERKYREALGDRLKAVYTYGQPMIGDPRFAEACERDEFLHDNVIRYIYDRDVVPHLPPSTSGPFRHFGREYRYEIPHIRNVVADVLGRSESHAGGHTGEWRTGGHPAGQVPHLLGMPISAPAFVARMIPVARSLPAVYSIDDHLPHHYLSALTPPGVQNEFGD
ncbi:lipase family protein [Microtetraspora sp. AC03309]|uniref:lipase family protein n=1 Tax=Microtetraspora sp. AC03309 TaxID=2779376 RepID=UPI001E61FAA9|nr:lipase family protein [Microtetraspora sp. AC03309]MCC5580400.1 lipase family protein [Microtetraspora sp. AC03309]